MKKYRLIVMVLLFSMLNGALINRAFAADIQLGAGDVIKISVYDHPDLALETRINEDGSISFPLIGDVSVGGFSTSVNEKKIANLLETGGFIHNAQVNIIVTSMQSQVVSVLGQVNRPGRYAIDGKRSLTDILALAGGGNADAGDTVTVIRQRDGKTQKEVIDLIEMVRTGDMQLNQELLGGDVIYVERAPRFYIYGEIQRPGAYRLERNMTVLQALSVGGGLSQRGTARGVRLKRLDEKGVLQETTVQHGDKVGPDDVLYVQESLF